MGVEASPDQKAEPVAAVSDIAAYDETHGGENGGVDSGIVACFQP